MTKKEFEEVLKSEVAEAGMTLAAYGVKMTPTTKDDEILAAIADYSGLIAERIKFIADANPDNKKARTSAMVILRKIAELSGKKWLKWAVSFLDRFI